MTARVFISYSHDSSEHVKRIYEFSNKLREQGIESFIDQYEKSPPDGWPAWCEMQIRLADFVLVACTETYLRRVNREEEEGVGKGVRWEGSIIYQWVYDEIADYNKFIPILFDEGKPEFVPIPLRRFPYFRIESGPGFESLLFQFAKKGRGQAQPLSPGKRESDFFADQSLADAAAFRRHMIHYCGQILAWHRVKKASSFCLSFRVADGSETPLAQEYMERNDRVIILGAPGSGKSVCLLKALQKYGMTALGHLQKDSQDGIPVVPVYLEVGQAKVSDANELAMMILERLGIPMRVSVRALSLIQGFVSAHKTGLLLLFDGLNELDEDFRPAFAASLMELDQVLSARVESRPLKVVITSRIFGFHDLFESRGYALAEVLPVEEMQIKGEIARYMSAERSESFYGKLDIKLRQFLSNPQNLDFLLLYVGENKDTGTDGTALQSRSQLIRHCIEKKLAGLPPSLQDNARQVLMDLGHQCATKGIYFSEKTIFDTARSILRKSGKELGAEKLKNACFDAGLVEMHRNLVRFTHHSIQQYFCACRMMLLWEPAAFVGEPKWHEPLALMAGLLEDKQLHDLLKRLKPRRKLYAYVLSHINRSDLESDFIGRTVQNLINNVKRHSSRNARLLGGFLLAWFSAFPFLMIAGMKAHDHIHGPAAEISMLVILLFYTFAFPPLLLAYLDRRRQKSIARLRNEVLPDAISVLRMLMASGAINQVYSSLEVLRRRMDFLPDDPRVMFVEDAIATLGEAASIPAVLDEDEMLNHLDDPLIAANLRLDNLSSESHNALLLKCEMSEDAIAVSAMKLAGEISKANPAFKEKALRVLTEIFASPAYSKARRMHAESILSELGVEASAKASLLHFVKILVTFIHRFSRAMRRGGN